MLPDHLKRNDHELSIIKSIASTGEDKPVLMLNMNRYKAEAVYPSGDLYVRYMSGLTAFLTAVGARILWRIPVLGQAVGKHRIDEIVAVWYPTHKAFLDLTGAPGAERNYQLRSLCVDSAVIHRCPGDQYPMQPRHG